MGSTGRRGELDNSAHILFWICWIMQRCGCWAEIILLLLSPHVVGFVRLPSIVFFLHCAAEKAVKMGQEKLHCFFHKLHRQDQLLFFSLYLHMCDTVLTQCFIIHQNWPPVSAVKGISARLKRAVITLWYSSPAVLPLMWPALSFPRLWEKYPLTRLQKMETISRMFLTAGCLQYVSSWKASEIFSSSCVSHLRACQALQSGIYIEVTDLGRIQRKPTEDLFSVQQLPIVISKMDTLYLLKHICCGNHLIM